MDALPKTPPTLAAGHTPGTTGPGKTRANSGADEPSDATPDSHGADAFMAALQAQGSLIAVTPTDTATVPTAFPIAGTEAGSGQVLPLVRPLFAALLPAALRPAVRDTSASEGGVTSAVDELTAPPGSATSAALALDELASVAVPAGGMRSDAAISTAANMQSVLDFVRDGANTMELASSTPVTSAVDGLAAQGSTRATSMVTEQSAYAARHAPLPVAQGDLFAERLNQQISVMLSQHNQQARIACAPPELGPVDVRITIVGDEASVQLAAPHAATREALEEALPRLRAALADSGLALGQAGVFADLPQRQQQATSEVREAISTISIDTELETPDAPVRMTRLGLVDAFV